MTARELAPPEAPPSDPSSSGVRSDRGERSARSSRLGAALVGGRYRSLFVLGRGGMGTVEAALAGAEDVAADPDHAYERVVALKRLLPDAARDKRRVDMFLREARLAKMLDHPNVVGAYDYGEREGELYLAMEYVEGQPLSRVLRTLADKGETMPVATCAFVLAEVCRGLHAAHELVDPETKQALQVVHRDVSPQNVMLGYDGRVRLLDFGVAKIETENVTKTGEVKGKTAYMSPEQAMGDPLDRRSDLFGVGAILFECLALRRMWGDGTDMEVIRRLALEEPPGLEDVRSAGNGPELPAEIVTLHRRLVAREAKERPATAAEVATALSVFAGDTDKAEAELRKILEVHFADQAREQRERLTASLREVAPAQADELRESVLPTTALTPIRIRPKERAAPLPAPASASRKIPRMAIAIVAIAAAVAGFRLFGSAPPPPPPPRPEPITTTAPATTTPPQPTATAPPTTGSAQAPSAAPPGSADPSSAPTASPPSAAVRPQPSAARRPDAPSLPPSTRPTAPSARPTAAPPPSAKPPDVFEHPF